MVTEFLFTLSIDEEAASSMIVNIVVEHDGRLRCGLR